MTSIAAPLHRTMAPPAQCPQRKHGWVFQHIGVQDLWLSQCAVFIELIRAFLLTPTFVWLRNEMSDGNYPMI